VVKHTEKRVSLMNEIINSIRLIKMYAWEESFSAKIKKIRIDEMKALQKTAFLQSMSFSITPCITVVAAIVTVIALT
jgi:ATP-binding cassette subfamily C (CFTR/MRP) protein 5